MPACQSLQTQTPPINPATHEDLVAVEEALNKQLVLQAVQQAEFTQANQEVNSQLARQQQQFNKLNLVLNQLREQLGSLASQTASPNTASKPNQIVTENNKLILGQQELIGLTEPRLVLPARVDTGARTSSLHATNIRNFERDGQTWLRFSSNHPSLAKAAEKTITLEAPLLRRTKIKQASGQEERLVINLEILLGQLTQTVEFTLTDRTSLEFPLLLGRNFFMDIALVDVSKNNVQGEPKFAPLQTPAEEPETTSPEASLTPTSPNTENPSANE